MPDEQPVMTIEEAQRRVDVIAASVGDDEGAHIEEDSLRNDILVAIAGGDANPVGLAMIALKTNDLNFSRWCA